MREILKENDKNLGFSDTFDSDDVSEEKEEFKESASGDPQLLADK